MTLASVRTQARRVLKGIRGVFDLDSYERYVKHRNLHHPGEPMLTEGEFWKNTWAEQDRNPQARCC
ncbi:MAG: YbdD/YjiX family protein [Propionibacteriaceae bacterium]